MQVEVIKNGSDILGLVVTYSNGGQRLVEAPMNGQKAFVKKYTETLKTLEASTKLSPFASPKAKLASERKLLDDVLRACVDVPIYHMAIA